MDRHYKWTAVLLPDPARPSLPRLVLRRIPAPPGSPAEPAPEHNYSPCSPFRAICSSSPGSHHGPPAGPAPERKRMKNLGLLMKRREQSGSRWSERVAEDPGKSHLGSSGRSPLGSLTRTSPTSGSPHGSLLDSGTSPCSSSRFSSRSSSHSSSRSSSRFSSSSSSRSFSLSFSSSSSRSSSNSSSSSSSCFWSLVPTAPPTRITLRRPQRTSSSLQTPREPLEPAAPWENQPVGNVPVKKSIRLLMKKRTQVGGAVRHSKKV
ncbi:Autophagy-related protein 20 [Dissostichus eleginoides]|uniref:Autophagy-related protein 20 n=1 Tax=Dissostichus eleginoides TaxID=100907 RepID=A0AAD9FIE1_DISEL|nr:Autophagy-related protein 20 [Dissostichus eleginoides]